MRGWSAIVVGFLLLGVALWSFASDGFSSSTVMVAAAAAFTFVRGAQGLGFGEVGAPAALVDFAMNPAAAIVDTAADRLSDWLDDAPVPPSSKAEKFDPDAVVARYVEQRGTEPAAAPAPAAASPAPVRTFGRKRV
jgi:hypothetical protein